MSDDLLARAADRVRQVRQRIAEQEARILKLSSAGMDTDVAEEVLANLKRSRAICEGNYFSLGGSNEALGGS